MNTYERLTNTKSHQKKMSNIIEGYWYLMNRLWSFPLHGISQVNQQFNIISHNRRKNVGKISKNDTVAHQSISPNITTRLSHFLSLYPLLRKKTHPAPGNQ